MVIRKKNKKLEVKKNKFEKFEQTSLDPSAEYNYIECNLH
jgi:hypothetical protein